MKRFILAGILCSMFFVISARYELHNRNLNGTIFRDITESTGIFHQGWGKCIALADWDGDGLLDVYLSVVYGKNKLYQNEGNMKFRDMSEIMRVDDHRDAHGVVIADFTNNGYPDIFVANNLEALSQTRGELDHRNVFYFGYDEGFVEVAVEAGVGGGPNYSCGVTTADINGNGFLDLFVAKGGYRKGFDCANSLYLNNGDGTFRDVAQEAGLADMGNGYSCSFSDYNLNGFPDLAVGNINDVPEPKAFILYRNNGDGTFTDVTKELGMERYGTCISLFWADFNNDGYPDLFLGMSAGPGNLDPEYGRNVLFMNNGDGTFRDASKEAGVDIVSNTRGATVGDINNSGWLDIIVTNSAAETHILINDGTGKFTESHKVTGGGYYYGHGVALGDLDNDGDLDFLGGNWRRRSLDNTGKWYVFENLTNNNNWLKVDLEGTVSNRSAVMSKISVYEAGRAKQRNALRGYREVTAGNGTFPGNPLQQHFGLDVSRRYDVVVVFPSGREVIERNVQPGRTLKIVEPR